MKLSRIMIYLIVLLSFSGTAAADLIIEKTTVIDTNDTEMWSPAWNPEGDSIAYAAYDNFRNQQIFTIKTDGTGKKQATNDTNRKWGVSWLKDEISFLSYDTDGLEKIFLVQPDGSGRKKLLDDKSRQGREPDGKERALGGVSWNPERKTMLFTSYDRMQTEKIYEVNMDGTGKKQLIDDEFRQWDPDLSPDGRSFVYISYDTTNNEQLFTANADGTGKKQITFDSIKKSDPNWGHEGILFVSYETALSSGEKIFIINPDGTGKRLLLEDGFKQRNPRWSRDWTKIIYEDIDIKGKTTFKVLYLQKPEVTITPALSPTPFITQTVTETIFPTKTEPPEAEETPAGGALKEVVLTMVLVLGIIVIVMLAVLVISDILSKK